MNIDNMTEDPFIYATNEWNQLPIAEVIVANLTWRREVIRAWIGYNKRCKKLFLIHLLN